MSAADYLPAERGDLAALRAAAGSCRGCDLWERAAQAVFGAGAPASPLMLIGEQPGDHEDRRGEPFVGPAGRLLDEALARAGIDRGDTYVTNAVKHFNWAGTSGGRRLHKTPLPRHIAACAPWWHAEVAAVRPQLVVLLGATAARAVFGSAFRLSAHRGEVLETEFGVPATATLHPSAVLRGRPEDREARLAGLVADLRRARERIDDAR